jgi:hypothetical protein
MRGLPRHPDLAKRATALHFTMSMPDVRIGVENRYWSNPGNGTFNVLRPIEHLPPGVRLRVSPRSLQTQRRDCVRKDER